MYYLNHNCGEHRVMRKYHHYGIPTDLKRADETLVETQGFKFYSTPFEQNKWQIQWHRFPEGHGLPELITQVPHIAFQVDDLDAEIDKNKLSKICHYFNLLKVQLFITTVEVNKLEKVFEDFEMFHVEQN